MNQTVTTNKFQSQSSFNNPRVKIQKLNQPNVKYEGVNLNFRIIFSISNCNSSCPILNELQVFSRVFAIPINFEVTKVYND